MAFFSNTQPNQNRSGSLGFGFGSNNSTSTGSTGAFGQTPAFGQSNSGVGGNAFGQVGSTSSFGGFGQQQPQQTSSNSFSGFGSNTGSNAFATNQTSNAGFNAFGQQPQSQPSSTFGGSNLFGQTSNSTTPSFGGFGQPSSTPSTSFGQPSNNLFGQTQNQPTNSFGSATNSFGSFGNTSNTNQSTNSFGTNNNAFGGSNFMSNNTNSFNQNQNQPPTAPLGTRNRGAFDPYFAEFADANNKALTLRSKVHCLTAAKPYLFKSPDELRLEDESLGYNLDSGNSGFQPQLQTQQPASSSFSFNTQPQTNNMLPSSQPTSTFNFGQQQPQPTSSFNFGNSSSFNNTSTQPTSLFGNFGNSTSSSSNSFMPPSLNLGTSNPASSSSFTSSWGAPTSSFSLAPTSQSAPATSSWSFNQSSSSSLSSFSLNPASSSSFSTPAAATSSLFPSSGSLNFSTPAFSMGASSASTTTSAFPGFSSFNFSSPSTTSQSTFSFAQPAAAAPPQVVQTIPIPKLDETAYLTSFLNSSSKQISQTATAIGVGLAPSAGLASASTVQDSALLSTTMLSKSSPMKPYSVAAPKSASKLRAKQFTPLSLGSINPTILSTPQTLENGSQVFPSLVPLPASSLVAGLLPAASSTPTPMDSLVSRRTNRRALTAIMPQIIDIYTPVINREHEINQSAKKAIESPVSSSQVARESEQKYDLVYPSLQTPNEKALDRRSPIKSAAIIASPIAPVSAERNNNSAITPTQPAKNLFVPRLTDDTLQTIPSYQELCQMSQDELEAVPNFTLIHPELGSVSWEGLTDVTYVDLDRTVLFSRNPRSDSGCVIEVYPEGMALPHVGDKLNKTALITIHNCIPKFNANEDELEQITKYERKLRYLCDRNGTIFIDYNPENGDWVFQVPNFS